jgi:CubicO group peptidase (beta-lactamase class C family)
MTDFTHHFKPSSLESGVAPSGHSSSAKMRHWLQSWLPTCSTRAFWIVIAVIVALSGGTHSANAQATAPIPAQVRIDFTTQRMTQIAAKGFADRATGRLVTADDPVRIASVSKMFVSFAVLRLVEAHKLDLSMDISNYLGFRVRNPAFPDTPVTIDQLLSHTSSLTDSAEYVIPLGVTLEERLRDPKAWDKVYAPGTYFRYTNLNFPVVATIIERMTGERFDRFMARTVFRPLRLDACFNWTTCSDRQIRRAVVLYDSKGAVVRDNLMGKQPACPVNAAVDGSCDLATYRIGTNGSLFSPQGGLRISARDLARVGQMLLRKGKGPSGRFLSAAAIDAMVQPRWFFEGNGIDKGDTEKGFFCTYGLALQTIGWGGPGCDDDLFGDRRGRIGHAGEAYGLKSGLWIDREAGTGTVFFVTSVPDDAPRGVSAFYRVEEDVIGRPK